jgi:hypothetical protein
MPARFGDGLYWFFAGAALLTVTAVTFIAVRNVQQGLDVNLDDTTGALAAAGILWLIGHICRYVANSSGSP